MNADYIAGLEEAYRLLNLDEELDYGPGRILKRVEQMKGEMMKTKTIIERMDEAQRIKETDFQLMALEKMTKERDDLSAKLQQAESALAQREDQLRRVEAQAGAMRECLEDICDKIAQDCLYDPGDVEQFCKRIRYACDSAEAGQSLLARLEEARWIESTLHLISGHTSTPLWIKEKIRDVLTPPIDNKCVVPAEKRGVEKGKEELRGSGAQQLNWTTDGFNHRAQGRRRVYWVKTEPLGANRFRPAIQRGAVTFYCDCPFDKLDDAKVFCQSDHDSVCDIALEESEEKLELMKTQAEAQCAGMREALEFYGDPETYFAIAILPDPPCGEFADDYSETNTDLGVRHGKKAREALATDCGKSILARLEEARELINDVTATAQGEAWFKRRDDFNKGHTPTGQSYRAAELEKEHDEEIGDFQNEVRNLVIKLSGAPDSAIDGKGSDAGWQEFTLSEISQGFAFLADKTESDRALLATARELLSRCPGIRTDETREYWDEVQAFLGREA